MFITFKIVHFKILLKSKKLSKKKTGFVPSCPHDGLRWDRYITCQIHFFKYINTGTYL